MWNKNMKEMLMDTRLLLLSKPNKYGVKIVVIASLEEWKGKRILMFPMGYVELLKQY